MNYITSIKKILVVKLWVIIFTLLLVAGCGTANTKKLQEFEDNLVCGKSRKDIELLVAKAEITHYECNEIPENPSVKFVAYDCWAQESSRIFKLRFNREGKLSSYQVIRSTGIKKVEREEIKYLCQ